MVTESGLILKTDKNPATISCKNQPSAYAYFKNFTTFLEEDENKQKIIQTIHTQKNYI